MTAPRDPNEIPGDDAAGPEPDGLVAAADDDPSPPAASPQTRRAILAAGVGALVGLLGGALGRPLPATAANGSPILAGRTASASATTTIRTTAGTGLQARSSSKTGRGIIASATATTGTTYGVYASTSSTAGIGVRGVASAGSGATTGVYGTTASPAGIGVRGAATSTTQAGSTVGVYGTSASGRGIGVKGAATAVAPEQNIGVLGTAAGAFGSGVKGVAASAAFAPTIGVEGESWSQQGTGVRGWARSAEGDTFGVYGMAASPGGVGVGGDGSTGVAGRATSPEGAGVRGLNEATSGNPVGVHGSTGGTTFLSAGVYGIGEGGQANGVFGQAIGGDGVAGVFALCDEPTGYGAYVRNNGGGYGLYVEGASAIDGSLDVAGTLSKSAGSFRIDHPLDPANRYLLHSFVESPDMKNVYDGVVGLDGDGAATVELPAWFEALNGDVRYQLTPLGSAMPDLHVTRQVKDNRFRVAGGEPGGRVCWQVTGIRRDAYAEAHRIPVEERKTGREKGRYLHPKEHGKPASRGIAALRARPTSKE